MGIATVIIGVVVFLAILHNTEKWSEKRTKARLRAYHEWRITCPICANPNTNKTERASWSNLYQCPKCGFCFECRTCGYPGFQH